ncbi:NDP-sugar epimerase, includes UDP-GlcNAc-inverting 4,6-dehydratase FlaA1 and capsular polysaccharide biosynthesis protein EpsC [Oribacterium sp. KHPX15]|uniref:polysaccharide biosynthesis protein n=1 Tax=Oribacterium sp. KHPX15 TaxID=1855342 RepID=UPI00089B5002|nr:nucleoside-diphosphate sugar epimerase/dehydratase [Oribacterium sp. KHPX15]SEA81376.1 NDP-sugar epimerase, includes UDP-GlcNAc-inverting 4,6-dehydratase FlaA1 and capsular polysaccharide biosynthesis protein EpsC [Oribacterium sp. KHPX15]
MAAEKKQNRNNEKNTRNYHERLVMLMFADGLSMVLSYFLGLFIRYEFVIGSIPKNYIDNLIRFLPWLILSSFIVYYIFRLYHSIWRFAGVSEVNRILKAYMVIGILLIGHGFAMPYWIPRSVALIGYFSSLFFCVFIRFGYRIVRYNLNLRRNKMNVDGLDKVLLVGAGQAARTIIREQQVSKKTEFVIKTVVDDSPRLQGKYIEGNRIEGTREDIPRLVKEYDINKIVFAIPTASKKDRADILNICKDTGCKVQTVPGIDQLVNGEVSIKKIRDVEITDLLGRDEVHVNLDEIKKAIKDKVIMVTGGGGSIGSELCRQIAASEPKQLIIFDIYENNAYSIEQELKRKYPELDVVTLIGSVRNEARIEDVIKAYHPYIIYHAAAHKHVPLMETSPNEAIKNNVMGTYYTAKAAAENGVRRFLLISTDKAVNPTSLMGASKRICEMIIQMMSRKYPKTVFMAVRFGNVLGSNGSVIPLFKKQIAEGGPVTVTDPEMTRYFMTIPEAVSLVLEASYYAKGGEIFVLDMGKPVKIMDLAVNMIKLSGFTADENGIPIKIVGLRPGEKMYEELLMDEEGLQKTQNELIYIGKPIDMDDEIFIKMLKRLDEESMKESGDIKALVAEVVPTYKVEAKSKKSIA